MPKAQAQDENSRDLLVSQKVEKKKNMAAKWAGWQASPALTYPSTVMYQVRRGLMGSRRMK